MFQAKAYYSECITMIMHSGIECIGHQINYVAK